MASVSAIELIPSTVGTATITGDKKTTEWYQKDYIGWIHVSANNGSTTITGSIEHSADGVNWITLATFAAITNTTGVKAVTVSGPVFPFIRGVATFTAGNSATVSMKIHYDKLR